MNDLRAKAVMLAFLVLVGSEFIFAQPPTDLGLAMNLVDTGPRPNDGARRTAMAFAYQTTRPGAETERNQATRLLLAGLDGAWSESTKVFAVELLSVVGARGDTATKDALVRCAKVKELTEAANLALARLIEDGAPQTAAPQSTDAARIHAAALAAIDANPPDAEIRFRLLLEHLKTCDRGDCAAGAIRRLSLDPDPNWLRLVLSRGTLPGAAEATFFFRYRLASKRKNIDRATSLETGLDVYARTANPKLRSYAKKLVQELGVDDAALAQRRGVLREWHVAGPFPKSEDSQYAGHAFSTDIVDTAKPLTHDGISQAWNLLTTTDEDGKVDLQTSLKTPERAPEDCCAFAVTTFEVPANIEAILLLGSDDGIVVFVNGVQVFENRKGRGLNPDEDRVKLSLRAGSNTVLFKIHQEKSGFGFCARLVEENGAAIRSGPPKK